MPAIPLVVPETKPATSIVPAGVTAPVMLPGNGTVPGLKAPSIAPPSELPAPALPTLTLPPELPKLELPSTAVPPVAPDTAPKAPVLSPVTPITPLVMVPPVQELPAPAVFNPAPIAPPAKTVALPEPSMPVKPELKLPEVKSGYNSTPEAPVALPKPVEVAPMPSPTTKVTPTGEDTMKFKPTQAIKSAVAGAVLATSPAFAEDPKVPTQTADVKSLETDLKAQLATLKDEIKQLKEKQSTYNDLIAGRADGKVNNPIDAGLMKRVENLETRLKRIEESLKKLDDKLASSTSAASPLSGVGNALPAGKSRVRLVNEYPIKISIVVNGTSYPLEAKQMKDLEVPSGSFTYQLIAEGTDKVSSNIKEGETVTLRIR